MSRLLRELSSIGFPISRLSELALFSLIPINSPTNHWGKIVFEIQADLGRALPHSFFISYKNIIEKQEKKENLPCIAKANNAKQQDYQNNCRTCKILTVMKQLHPGNACNLLNVVK